MMSKISLWSPFQPIANAFVCNIGDMLDLLTGGFYRSNPHRVKNVSGRDRLSSFLIPILMLNFTRSPSKTRSQIMASMSSGTTQIFTNFKELLVIMSSIKLPRFFPNFSRTVSKSIVNKPLSLGVRPQTLSLNGLTPIPSPKKEAEGFQEKSDGNPIGAQAVR